MKKILLSVLCLAVFGFVSCTSRKDKLTADTLVISIDPTAVSVSTGAAKNLTAICKSARSGNADVSPTWAVDSNLGTFNPKSGKTTTFTAGTTVGTGKIYATYSGVIGKATVNISTSATVTSPPPPPPPGVTILAIYSDSGLLAEGTHIPDIPKWGSIANAGLVEQTSGGGASGDSAKYMRDSSGADTYVGWGVTLDKNDATYKRDLSAFAAGHIKFYLKTDRALAATDRVFINVEEANGTKTPNIIIDATYGWNNGNSSWQQVSVPVSALTGISLTNVHLPFEITVDGGNLTALSSPIIMDVDYVRWTSN